MSDDREPALHAAIEALYAVFAPYPPPPASVFCTFCNTEDEIADLVTTALRALGPEPARRLLWETGDHWGGADAYKHYLPRVLEALAPPERCADLYPMHLFEVLAFLQFGTWPAAERAAVNYDHPSALETELLAAHLVSLREGRDIDAPIYDYVAHTRSAKTRRIAPCPIIIVEGILVFAEPQLRELFDMKIFVDTDADIRLMRRIRRDIEQRGRTFAAIRDQYYSTVRPMHLEFVEPSKRFADLIIPEGGDNRVALELLLGRFAHVAFGP